MIPLHDLPALNAVLNGTSACLLVAGYVAIRRGRIAVHRALMLGAVLTSALFLASYVTYHLHVGATRFAGPPGVRVLYLSILSTHTALAVAIVPLVAVTLYRALRARFDRHRRIARWTLPAWLYVSVTGVVIYLMLYQLYPARPPGDHELAGAGRSALTSTEMERGTGERGAREQGTETGTGTRTEAGTGTGPRRGARPPSDGGVP